MKDRYGRTIRDGDVVATAITINRHVFTGFDFATYVVKRKKNRRILDGQHCWCYLIDRKPSEIVVLHEGSDLSKIAADFIRDFPKE